MFAFLDDEVFGSHLLDLSCRLDQRELTTELTVLAVIHLEHIHHRKQLFQIVQLIVHPEIHRIHRDQLRRKNSALISVSLSAATPDGQQEARTYATSFAAATGWSPRRTLLLGGALDWPDCDYFQRQVLAQILANRGLTPDQKSRHEFTDWNALEKFVTDFVSARELER